VTIELSGELFAQASRRLADDPTIEVLGGDSRALLPGLVNREVATLFFLDGHWSGGHTAGSDSECPVLDELVALRGGHADDCFFIDDARLFTAPPAPPHDPSHWPSLIEVVDSLRAGWPEHHITLLADQMIAVPQAGRPLVDRYGQTLASRDSSSGSRPGPIARMRDRLEGALFRRRAM
jgi:hypothetical protein